MKLRRVFILELNGYKVTVESAIVEKYGKELRERGVSIREGNIVLDLEDTELESILVLQSD